VGASKRKGITKKKVAKVKKKKKRRKGNRRKERHQKNARRTPSEKRQQIQQRGARSLSYRLDNKRNAVDRQASGPFLLGGPPFRGPAATGSARLLAYALRGAASSYVFG